LHGSYTTYQLDSGASGIDIMCNGHGCSLNAVSQMVTPVLGSPSFSTNDLMASRVDLVHVFRLVATLCECGSVAIMSAKVCEGVDVGQLMAGDVAVEQPVILGVDSP